jgi:hypothetical protein
MVSWKLRGQLMPFRGPHRHEPQQSQANKCCETEPAYGSLPKYDSCIEGDEGKERVKAVRNPSRPSAVMVKTTPPPDHVDKPGSSKRIVKVQTTAPGPADNPVRYQRRVLICSRMAPIVGKMKCADDVPQVEKQAQCPSPPRPPLGFSVFAISQQTRRCHDAETKRDPDCPLSDHVQLTGKCGMWESR